jgi:hypothetical protein
MRSVGQSVEWKLAEETCPSATFSTKNPTYPDLESNPGRRGGKPAINRLNFFLVLVCEAIGTAATLGLLCQPRVIVKMIVEKQMECRLAGETEALGETLPQRHFCPSQNPTWPDPGRRGEKPTTNRLSYGAAQLTALAMARPTTMA